VSSIAQSMYPTDTPQPRKIKAQPTYFLILQGKLLLMPILLAEVGDEEGAIPLENGLHSNSKRHPDY
jgi:hypothetical protein